MILKSLLTGICVAFFAIAAHAEETTRYLHVQSPSGWTVLNLDTVDRLTFNGGNMVVTDSDKKVLGTFPQSTLMSMHVDNRTDSWAGTEIIGEETLKATFSVNSTRLVTMLTDGEFDIYSLDGRLLVHIADAKATQTVDLSLMNEKVLILKSGDYALKTIRK